MDNLQGDSVDNKQPTKMVDRTPADHVYTCPQCGIVLARTQYPMDPEGVAAKRRRHICPNSGKREFEEELR